MTTRMEGEARPGAPATDGWWWPSGPVPPEPGEVAGAVRLPRVSAESLGSLLEHLDRAGQALAARPVSTVVEALGRAGERLLEDRVEAVSRAVAREALLSEAMAERVVVGMARGWTREALQGLLASELDGGAVLDGFVSRGTRRIRAVARGATLHVGSGSVPGVSATSLIRALLVKSPSLVKPGMGDVAMTVAYLDVLRDVDPDVASAAAVLYWPGGAAAHDGVEARVTAWARQVVVYGGEEVVRRIRGIVDPSTEVVVHPNRIGVVVADRSAPADPVAEAVATFDQRGCVSPQVVLFVGDADAADDWGDAVAAAFDRVEVRWPPGPVDASERSRVQQHRGSLELRTAAGEPVRVRYRPDGRWTVVRAPLAEVVPLGDRTLWIVPCPGRADLAGALATLGPALQSVGVSVSEGREEVVEAAVLAGASRAVPVESLAFPEPDWLHDGREPLRELVRWAESRG